MTPYEIGVLIHCYVSPTKHPQSDTKLFQQTIEMLMNEDMVYELEDHYTTTDRGNAYMKMLQTLQFPQLAWVDERGKVINI